MGGRTGCAVDQGHQQALAHRPRQPRRDCVANLLELIQRHQRLRVVVPAQTPARHSQQSRIWLKRVELHALECERVETHFLLQYLLAEPQILYQSGKPCARAYSRAEKERNSPGCMLRCEWIIMRPMHVVKISSHHSRARDLSPPLWSGLSGQRSSVVAPALLMQSIHPHSSSPSANEQPVQTARSTHIAGRCTWTDRGHRRGAAWTSPGACCCPARP